MIRLYDWLNQESKDLEYSLQEAGFAGQAVVINDDGFLPDGMTSPYSYFCGLEQAQDGRSLYFNEVPVPDFWRISGNNSKAEVWEMEDKRATIFYTEPKHERRVKNVDWYDRHDRVRLTDHFNKYGWLFARTSFNLDKQVTVKTYYNKAGQEIITENFQTGDIILNWDGQVHFFKSRVAFLVFYFDYVGLDTSAIWYNSLSTPYFLSRYIVDRAGSDILFWQEEMGDSIPGNMQLIFNGGPERTKKIIVQNKAAYEKLLSLLPADKHDMVAYLGYIYPEKEHKSAGREILLMTNSDQIEQLDKLVPALPDFTFHIGALTEMSSRLMAFDAYENVHLYPNIPMTQADQLFASCDIYLDINHGDEILSAGRRAFEEDMVLFAFDNTAHARNFTAGDFVLSSGQVDSLIQLIQAFPQERANYLMKQRPRTKEELVAAYRNLLA